MTRVFLVAALFVCPVGAVIDRVEGDRAVVLGATGVRVVARTDLTAVRRRIPHEGDRLEQGPLGSCIAFPPGPDELGRVRAMLRALEHRVPNVQPR